MSERSLFAVVASAACMCWTVGCTIGWEIERGPKIDRSGNVIPTARSNHCLAKGITHYAKGNLDRARTQFEAAILADDRSGLAHNNLGLVLYELGDFHSAAKSFQLAIERMPNHAEPLYNLGLTLEESEKYNEALGLYLQAYSIEPENPHYLGNAIRTRKKLGEPVEALVPDLQDLLVIETRPEWRDWIRTLLHYETVANGKATSNLDVVDDSIEELPTPGLQLSAPLP